MKNTPHKFITDIKILGIIIIASLLIYGIGMVASFPTQKHRTIEKEIRTLSFTPDSSAKVEALQKTPESHYSNTVVTADVFFQLFSFIAIIYITYTHILRNRIHRNILGATILLVSLGTVTASTIFSYINAQYIGIPLEQFFVIISIFSSLIITSIMVTIITLIIGYFYKRKHSFLDE